MKLAPSKVRIILSLILVIVVGTIFGGAYYAYTFLSGTSNELSALRGEVATADAKIQNISLLKKQMEDNKSVIEKAKWISAETKMYKYQNQIINDISAFADKAGVSIQSFVFDNNSAGGGKTSTQKSASNKSNSQINSRTVSVELSGSNEYTKILHFMHLLEHNVTRMQMLGVSLSPEKDANGNLTVQSISMEVYVK